jgi:ribosome-associated heat shock protein Hsp15
LSDPRPLIRIDRWLWFARFFKSRAQATKQVSNGHVRLNAVKISKPAHMVGPGDTLTFAQARSIRVVRILATGTRRGPASEAQTLYQDLTPAEPSPRPKPKSELRGKPTKKERRDHARMRRDMLE